MSKQVQGNPTRNRSLSITSYTFSATTGSGGITVTNGQDFSVFKNGQSLILKTSGGNAYGYENGGEYFAYSITSGSFKIAKTKKDAIIGSGDFSLSGNIGSGIIYPNYDVGGILFIGTSGDINMRGTAEGCSFSLHQRVSDDSTFPFMIKDINASGTTAGNFVVWND